MDNAVVTSPNASPAQTVTFAGRLNAMPARSKLSALIGVAALAGVVYAMTAWNSHGDYKVLYANLADRDGGAVIAQLSQMNVPYRMSEGGAAILVPAAQVHDLRLKMATAGLPKGAVSGFELMDSARFGQTQFQERLTFQRGLEGELTRSIGSLAAVQAARVHLALPNQNGFFREQQKPSASVLLTLHPGRALDRAQIAGIVHLVSSSVPEMSPKAVSILDQSGALLTGGNDAGQGGGLDAQQLQYVGQIEAGFTKRIIELVEPIVGPGNLRASVTADVDFSQTEATSEEFKPNQGADASISIRSQQTTEQGGGAATALASGVPGAASNQPPIAATAPLTGASQPLQGAPSGNAAGSGGRREAVTNYEVDKTVRVTKSATGNVKRLNAAVVVNNRSVTDAKGKTTQVPLTSDELDKLTALVRESIGFNKERGDSVKVINAPFKVDPASTTTEMPFWKSPELIDLIRAAALPAGLTLVAILVFFGLVRPAMKNVFVARPAQPARPGARIEAVVDDEHSYPAPALAAPAYLRQIEGAKALAKDNPAAVAGIVRGWVGGESA
jgi:flagellar M-ring protein FliF